MLAATNKSLLIYILVGEMILYILFKFVRGEITTSTRIDSFKIKLIDSFFSHIIVKVIGDFTGYVHWRHPSMMGGAYYSANMIWAQAFLFVALHLYTKAGRNHFCQRLEE